MRVEYYLGYNGTKIAVNIFEHSQNKPWILFWPGLTITPNSKYFKEVFLKLAENYTLLIPDLRGQGSSEGSFSFNELCEDMKIITNKVLEKQPNTILFGYSITASALVHLSSEFPNSSYVLFAPVISLKESIPSLVHKTVSLTSLREYSLPFMLFLFNVRTKKFEHKKFSELFTHWGCCRLASLNTIWDEVLAFSIDFSKVRQKGFVIYGDQDHLLVNDFEKLSQSSLEPVLLKDFDHFLKSSKVNSWEKKSKIFLDAVNKSVAQLTKVT